MKTTSHIILILLFICTGLFELFYLIPIFQEKRTFDMQAVDFLGQTYKSSMELFADYNKPVVWRIMTQKERQNYINKETKEKGIPSFQTMDICLINNFGRAITNPLRGDYYIPCDQEHLQKWITEANTAEKKAFEETGHCVDYLYWQDKQKQAELKAQSDKDNITFNMYMKIILSFIGIFLLFLTLWKLACFIFNSKQKNGVHKQQGKKYLDLSNIDK